MSKQEHSPKLASIKTLKLSFGNWNRILPPSVTSRTNALLVKSVTALLKLISLLVRVCIPPALPPIEPYPKAPDEPRLCPPLPLLRTSNKTSPLPLRFLALLLGAHRGSGKFFNKSLFVMTLCPKLTLLGISDFTRRCLFSLGGGGSGTGMPNTPAVPGVVVMARNGGFWTRLDRREWGGGNPAPPPTLSGCEGSLEAAHAKSEEDRVCLFGRARGEMGGMPEPGGRSGVCSLRRGGMAAAGDWGGFFRCWGEAAAEDGCWNPEEGSARSRAANSSRDDMLLLTGRLVDQ